MSKRVPKRLASQIVVAVLAGANRLLNPFAPSKTSSPWPTCVDEPGVSDMIDHRTVRTPIGRSGTGIVAVSEPNP